VPAGHTLTQQGTIGHQMFIVVEGTGSVSIDDEHVATIGPGEFVGEMAMLDRQPRTATVTAESPMRVLVVDPTAFNAFVRHEYIARAMAMQLSRRLRRVQSVR
jgi:CRP-like cAMP-binding protein